MPKAMCMNFVTVWTADGYSKVHPPQNFCKDHRFNDALISLPHIESCDFHSLVKDLSFSKLSEDSKTSASRDKASKEGIVSAMMKRKVLSLEQAEICTFKSLWNVKISECYEYLIYLY